MPMQYLLVNFPQERAVFADGSSVGTTNRVLMLPAGEYEITLDGTGYAPPCQDAVLNGTSPTNPLVLNFQATALPAKGTP